MNHELIEEMAAVLRDAPHLAEMEVRGPNGTLLRLRRAPVAPVSAAPPLSPAPPGSKGGSGAARNETAAAGGMSETAPPRPTLAAGIAASLMATPVQSTLVGVFHALPDGPPREGDTVTANQVLGRIEAMRLMNDCLAPVAGIITAVRVQSGQPVEYGQTLFEIVPAPEEQSQ